MWTYEKKLQFPVNIRKSDPALTKIVISQTDGLDGELAASMRYLNQRYAMPYSSVRAILMDIGTEECVHESYSPKKPLSMGDFRVQVEREIICGASITYRAPSFIPDIAQDLLQHGVLSKGAHILVLQEKLLRHWDNAGGAFDAFVLFYYFLLQRFLLFFDFCDSGGHLLRTLQEGVHVIDTFLQKAVNVIILSVQIHYFFL